MCIYCYINCKLLYANVFQIEQKKMSFRDLVEPDCGGANPLMRLGNAVMRDAAYKDEGLSRAGPAFRTNRPSPQEFGADQLVNEFLGQAAVAPPQTFRMDALLKEMREIDAHNFHSHVNRAPPVIEEVNNGLSWTNEFQNNLETVNSNIGLNKVKFFSFIVSIGKYLINCTLV